MNSVKKFVLAYSILIISFGCSKSAPGDGGADCEQKETTTVTFKNTTSASLTVEVAQTFNAQYAPNDPVVSTDIAPGASVVKVFRYGRYFIQWKNGCPSACSQRTFYAKSFEQCESYEENQ